jgi:tryptophanyl-tRNA synthetase
MNQPDFERPVVVTGDRPTGRLHLGHWVGTLETRLALQETCRSYFLVADLHLLSTHAHRATGTRDNTIDLTLDWLSAGLDPERSTFVVQSQVPEIAELSVLLSMLCPVSRAERIPALKEKREELGAGETYSLGLLSYPVLMAADVLLFKARKVPVGEDQVAHVELARELARRFNRLYGEILDEPEPVLSATPRLVGTDGARKMSKSLENAIYLSDDAATVDRRVRQMYTDPQRIRSDIPGTVEGNPIFVYHRLFNSDMAEVQDLEARYLAGKVGDVEVKDKLARALNRFLDPFRERRRSFQNRKESVRDILSEGSRKARAVAREHLRELLDRVGLEVPRARSAMT